jgi:hypothetical protein
MSRLVALLSAFVALASAQFGPVFPGNKGNFNAPPNFGPNCNLNQNRIGCACEEIFFFFFFFFFFLSFLPDDWLLLIVWLMD